MEPLEADLDWCYKLKEPSLVPRLTRYSLSVECIVGWTMCKTLHFCSILIMSWLHGKIPGSPRNRYSRSGGGHTNMEHVFINQFVWMKQDTLHIYAVYKMPMQIYICIVFILSGRTGSLDGPDQHWGLDTTGADTGWWSSQQGPSCEFSVNVHDGCLFPCPPRSPSLAQQMLAPGNVTSC